MQNQPFFLPFRHRSRHIPLTSRADRSLFNTHCMDSYAFRIQSINLPEGVCKFSPVSKGRPAITSILIFPNPVFLLGKSILHLGRGACRLRSVFPAAWTEGLLLILVTPASFSADNFSLSMVSARPASTVNSRILLKSNESLQYPITFEGPRRTIRWAFLPYIYAYNTKIMLPGKPAGSRYFCLQSFHKMRYQAVVLGGLRGHERTVKTPAFAKGIPT